MLWMLSTLTIVSFQILVLAQWYLTPVATLLMLWNKPCSLSGNKKQIYQKDYTGTMNSDLRTFTRINKELKWCDNEQLVTKT